MLCNLDNRCTVRLIFVGKSRFSINGVFVTPCQITRVFCVPVRIHRSFFVIPIVNNIQQIIIICNLKNFNTLYNNCCFTICCICCCIDFDQILVTVQI